ncbi:MAG: hypothetical protein ACRDSL_10940 [Pseudonocardiaceae bacterium]
MLTVLARQAAGWGPEDGVPGRRLVDVVNQLMGADNQHRDHKGSQDDDHDPPQDDHCDHDDKDGQEGREGGT